MDKERSAVLIHSYLDDRSGKDRPDKLTRLGILSAAELYRHGEVDVICVTVEPNLATPITKQLKSLLSDMPNENFMVKPVAVTTLQELSAFKKISRAENIDKLVAIADETHVPRAKRLSKLVFGKKANIDVVSSRDVLSHYPRYRNVLKESDSWPERFSLSKKEMLIEKISKIPILGKVLVIYLPDFIPSKVAFDMWFVRQFEKRTPHKTN